MNKTILLLGASNDAKGELSQMAIDRLECAYTVYSNNSHVKFLCTGGFGEHFSAEPTGQNRTVRGQKPTNQRFVGFFIAYKSCFQDNKRT